MPDDLYINEVLTPTRNTIMYVLPKAKKDFPVLVSGYCTNEGSMHVWCKTTEQQSSWCTEFEYTDKHIGKT